MEDYDILTLIRNSIDPNIVDDQPDIGIFMEIADRMNDNTVECKRGCKEITAYLKSPNRFKRWHAILLIECLVKNCKMRFHYELLGKEFCQTCLKILAKRRKVKALYYTLVTKEALQKDIEGKLLYLIQLWADTFMMHPSEFKQVIGLYHILRKEGVIFPPRDANAKYMIKFDGIESPIYQTMTSDQVYEEPSKMFRPSEKVKDFISDTTEFNHIGVNAETLNRHKHHHYIGQDYEETYGQIVGELQANLSSIEELGQDELGMLRESCLLLDEIMTNAEDLETLRGEIALEVIDSHEASLKRLKKVFHSSNIDLDDSTKERMGILYQTLKKQLSDFYDMVEEFKSNNNKRPSYLDYNKMKQRAIEDLQAWSKEHQQQQIEEEIKNEVEEKKENNHYNQEVDLLGLEDDIAEEKVHTVVPNKEKRQLPPPPEATKKVVQEIDLLDFGVTEAPPSDNQITDKTKQVTNTDLFNLDLNISGSNKYSIGQDDDDFFSNLANKRNKLLN